MLENTQPFDDALESGSDDSLRPLDWAELVARINAANDLRRVVAGQRSNGGFASFAAGISDNMAETNSTKQKAKRAVNLKPLEAGNYAAGNVVTHKGETSDGEQNKR